ncbi:MAG: flagellar protein export ATPase FliI [Ignavibacteria bacterium]|nr:flagellar protein export ATPase FliI [Ignavibacteria bacterium]
MNALLQKYTPIIHATRSVETVGRISQVVGMVLESNGPQAPIGEVCVLRNRAGQEVSRSEIVGFRDNKILSMVLGDFVGIEPGMEIVATGTTLTATVGNGLLGRILDGLGNPMDGKGPLPETSLRSIYAQPPNPLSRKRITEPMSTGVRAIDSLLTIGKGQRVGIFAGSGVGKSTLLGMIARNATADVNVIALIGERGREVRDFIEEDLGDEGLKRSVVVVATSDMPALVRVKAPLIATAIAEYFRDEGLDVMLMMDSVTRLALAQREIGLTIGEPPTTKGYTPSVFALLPKLMERAGTSAFGTITALYTVLVEGDDMNEPIADAARGILDGHIVLSRRLAALGHYPAIDILESVSRVMKDVITPQHREASQSMKEMLAAYREAEDMISVGAYQKGSNSLVDTAIELRMQTRKFLRQEVEDPTSYRDSITKLMEFGL